ncbi:MAG: M23 family metallopeptidase [Clostridia bacterium]|nr:M23 family metallopeptidase [Clostridia bacterium]
MKYYKTSKFTKAITSTGFVTIVACALIAVGAIAWFALSRDNTVSETPSDNSQSQQEYPDTNNSYNNTVEVPDVSEEPITDVDDDVSNVPYSEEEPTEPVEEKPTFVLPITGNISKGYSDTALQYSATYGDMRLHTGVDILCETGSDIKSAGTGTVKSVVDDANYGRIITIEHMGGITVKYCGMGSVNVKEGNKVAAGDVIGTSGDVPCECADNPHIHIEVTVDGNSSSPLAALGLE